MALFGARFPKENVFGETLQNFFLVFCLFWFVAVVVLRFGCFCHFGLLGVFFLQGGVEKALFLFSLYLGAYYSAISFFFL